MTTNDPKPTLQSVLNDFGKQQGVLPVHVHNLEFIIQHTPALQDAMRQAVEAQELQHLQLLPAGENAAGGYNAHSRTMSIRELNLHFVGKPDGQEASRLELISTVAHETQHALNRARSEQARQTFREEITALAQSGQPIIDYTQPLQKFQQAEVWDEATAEIAGWNAAVSYLQHQTPRQAITLQDIYTKYNRASDFMDASLPDAHGNRTYAMKTGFMPNTDMTLDAANPANIQAMRQYYFDPSFSMGECQNADYRNLYARRALLDVQKAHQDYAPHAKMMLDMPALGLSERLLEESGMPVFTPNGQMPYVDRQTPQVDRFFDHTYQSPNASPQQANPQAFQYVDNGNADPYTPPFPVPQCQRPAAGSAQQTGGSPRVAAEAQSTDGLSFFDRLVQAAQSGDPKALQPAAQGYLQTQEVQDWLKQGQELLQQEQFQQEQLQQEQAAQQQPQQSSGPVMRL